MTSFSNKVNLQQHHEAYGKTRPTLDTQGIRPNFLSSNPIASSFARPSGSLSPLRQRSNYGSSSRKSTLKKENKDSQRVNGISSRNSLDDFNITGTPNPLYSGIITKSMMRRKSCCCEWCGGASKLEMKHNNITSGKEESETKSMSKLEMKARAKENTGVILDRSSSRKPSLKVSSPTFKRQELGSKSTAKANKIKFLETPESMNINEYYSISSFEPDDSQRVTSTRAPKLVPRNEAKLKEQMSLRNFSQREQSMIQQSEQMEPAMWPQVKKVIRPVKLHRDFGLSSIRKRRYELEKMLSREDVPLTSSQSMNLMSSAKSGIFPKLISKISGLNSSKVDKTAKSATPFGENRKAKNVKLEAIDSFDSKTDVKSKTSSKFRGFFKPKPGNSNQRIRTEGDEPEESVESEGLSFSKYERQNESPRKLKMRRVSSQKTLIAFGATKEKIMKTYVERESVSPAKRAANETREENALERMVFDTHNILFMSSPQTDSIKFSFAENYSDYRERREEKAAVKSADNKRPKKRDGSKLKSREGQKQWLMHSFSLNKSSSLTVFPPLLSSVQSKVLRQREGTD